MTFASDTTYRNSTVNISYKISNRKIESITCSVTKFCHLKHWYLRDEINNAPLLNSISCMSNVNQVSLGIHFHKINNKNNYRQVKYKNYSQLRLKTEDNWSNVPLNQSLELRLRQLTDRLYLNIKFVNKYISTQHLPNLS